jgi:excinuclease ABC subunit A
VQQLYLGRKSRIKLTKELANVQLKNIIYTRRATTGLHFHDVKKLINVVQNLVDKEIQWS